MNQQGLLLLAVAGVGVFHTMVPDHWVPIALLARQRRWSSAKTARTAVACGLGHTLSTLVIGLMVWLVGVVFAARFGHIVSLLSSAALVAFGFWIAFASWREMRGDVAHHHTHEHGVAHDHSHDHRHDHSHDRGHEHSHAPKDGSRMAMMMILGSSPMVEGIPAFFAASRYGLAQIAWMSLIFAVSTIATYVILCAFSSAALQRTSLGRFERYGEVMSGLLIALVGIVFAFVSW